MDLSNSLCSEKERERERERERDSVLSLFLVSKDPRSIIDLFLVSKDSFYYRSVSCVQGFAVV